jgi:hypothetical protein
MTMDENERAGSKVGHVTVWTVLLLVTVIGLRLAGVFNFDIYKASFETAHSAQSSFTPGDEDKTANYHFTVQYDGESLSDHILRHGAGPMLEVTATVDEPTVSGGMSQPFVKHFSMEVPCHFSSPDTPGQPRFKGNAKVVVKAKIHGLCSARKARELAFAEAKKTLGTYFRRLR